MRLRKKEEQRNHIKTKLALETAKQNAIEYQKNSQEKVLFTCLSVE